MSGGSYNYVFGQIESLADNLRCDTPLRRAFQKHLRLVAKAAHDIEWVDSCDYGEGDDEDAIRACMPADAELRQATADARAVIVELERIIGGAA